MRAAHPLADQFLGAETENVKNLGTDERIAAIEIESDDQIGETVHESARKFLFAVEAALHFPLLGDVHETCPGSAQNSGGIADGRRRVHRNDFAALFAGVSA